MLNDRQIQSAMKSVQTEVTLNDGAGGRGTGSLVITIRRTAGGVSAQWFGKWKQGGKRAKKALGRYPDMPLALARQTFAAEVRPLLVEGKNPRAAAARAESPTVERLFQAYIASMRAKNRASVDEVERMLLTSPMSAAEDLGRTRLAGDITDADVVQHVAGFYKRGFRGAADKARSYIASAFAWGKKSANDYTSAERQDWGIKVNPAADVPRDAGASQTRERNLSAAELATLWNGADGEAAGFTLETAGCIRLLIACGQRVQETLRIEGREVDLDAALWTMPAHKTKGRKRAHTVPLTSQAVEVLRQLVEVHGQGPLFPARSGAKGLHIDHRSIQQAIDRWQPGGGLERFQTRDLRRTWKSRTADAGIDRFTRDLIQQHAKHDTGSKSYDRADYLPQMREAMAKWDAWLRVNTIPVREAA